MKFNHSRIILGLYVSVIFLLPFSRLAELPILILSITGLYGWVHNRKTLFQSSQFRVLSLVFSCYLILILFSSLDSYWQEKTLTVALASIRFYLAGIALLLYIKPKDTHLVFKIIAVLLVFWSVDALFQYFVGVDFIGRASYAGRLNGVFGEHHAKLGPVLALLLPMTMIALKNNHSVLRWLSIFIITIVILLSGTRSAWLMMFFSFLAYWFHHVKQRRFLLLFKGCVVSMVMLGSLWLISADFQKRIDRSLQALQGTEKGINFALADRLPIWETSWNMFLAHPINGIGAHAFRNAYPDYAAQDDILQADGDVGMHAHHWILEILAETGLIGLLFFSMAIFKLMQFVKRHYHEEYSWAFLIALLSAFLPFTSTYSIFASFWSLCIWFVGIGLILVSRKND